MTRWHIFKLKYIAGALPQTQLGELTALLGASNWISGAYCVLISDGIGAYF